MQTTSQHHRGCVSRIPAAAVRNPAAAFAVLVLALPASPTRAECNPAGRIDARCYSDLHDATAAAIAANAPLWLPAGTYVLDRELVIDYAPLATTGFQNHLGRRSD